MFRAFDDSICFQISLLITLKINSWPFANIFLIDRNSQRFWKLCYLIQAPLLRFEISLSFFCFYQVINFIIIILTLTSLQNWCAWSTNYLTLQNHFLLLLYHLIINKPWIQDPTSLRFIIFLIIIFSKLRFCKIYLVQNNSTISWCLSILFLVIHIFFILIDLIIILY